MLKNWTIMLLAVCLLLCSCSAAPSKETEGVGTPSTGIKETEAQLQTEPAAGEETKDTTPDKDLPEENTEPSKEPEQPSTGAADTTEPATQPDSGTTPTEPSEAPEQPDEENNQSSGGIELPDDDWT